VPDFGLQLQITANPDKTAYLCGEGFAPAGLQVRVIFPLIGYTSGDLAYNSNPDDFRFLLNNEVLESSDTLTGAEITTITVERMGVTGTFNIDVNHVSNGVWRTALAETCLTEGTEVSNCAGCDAENAIERISPALGHSWGALYGHTTDASCNTYGNRDCIRVGCGVTETDVFISIDHDFVGRIDCSECGHRYKIGDVGPGGGRIFYVADGEPWIPDNYSYPFTLYMDTGATFPECWDCEGTGCEVCDYKGFLIVFDDTIGSAVTAHYLEAAPAGWYGTINDPTLQWSLSSYYFVDEGTGTARGTGLRNTARILLQDANAPAAKACNDYENNGKNDWFLPSYMELLPLFYAYRNNPDDVDGFSPGWTAYWSSSQTENEVIGIGFILDGEKGNGWPYGTAHSKNSMNRVHPVRAF